MYKTPTSPAVVYSCEKWPLALEHGLGSVGKCCEDYVADNGENLI